jgi:DNA-binding transcriptional ArsR family regulator
MTRSNQLGNWFKKDSFSLDISNWIYNYIAMKEVITKPTAPDISLDAVFAALADPTRRAIVERLARGNATVTELAEPFRLSQPAISKHLKVLERAGLISQGRDAQRRPRHLEPQRIKQLSDWISSYKQYLEASYERLENYLQTLQAKEDSHDHLEA